MGQSNMVGMGDIEPDAKAALADLAKIYPDYKGQGYEIAGFVWCDIFPVDEYSLAHGFSKRPLMVNH